ATPDQLKALLALAVLLPAALFHNRQIGGQESFAHTAYESEQSFQIALQVIEEDAANAARFAAMFDEEVFVAPRFEAWVIRRVVLVADIFQGLVEVNDVFAEGVVRRQVRAAAEPRCCTFFQIAEVGMNGRNVRIVRMEHERNAGGEKFAGVRVSDPLSDLRGELR